MDKHGHQSTNNSLNAIDKSSQNEKEVSDNSLVTDDLMKPELMPAIPTATHVGVLDIGEFPINCYVLQDGRRVLSGRTVTKAMGLTGRATGMERLLSKSLLPYLSNKAIAAIKNPIVFKTKVGFRPLGYEAWLLPELCYAVIEADKNRTLTVQQSHMVIIAMSLAKAFSTVGIVALVDEATGYQEVRDRNALQEILRRYISADLLEWAKRFPDEFYKELFRLRGWSWNSLTTKRPGVVGKLTADIVYQRIAPGVLAMLRSKTPRNAKGHAKNKYHQFLTNEVGVPELDKHLHAILAFMRVSSSWPQFYRMLEKSFPKYSDTLPLPLDEADE